MPRISCEYGSRPNDGTPSRVIDGVARYVDWGLPSQELRSSFAPNASGWYRFALKYANFHGPINTGVTAAVKRVTARCGMEAEQTGSIAMPHLAETGLWGLSTGFFFKASGNAACELRIRDGLNMSYLSHFARYTAGEGGGMGALNRADIASGQIDRISGDSP